VIEIPAVGERSYWLAEALRADPGEPCPALAGDVAADVCIVGGGFAGLWTAYELSERAPSMRIVLLEADVCGAGGSGANGGFFSCSWHMVSSLCHFFGEAEGIRYAQALADQVGELETWCERHHADIDLHHEGIVYARAGTWQADHEADAKLLAAHGLSDRLVMMSAAEARRVADSPRFCGGAFTPDLATVQPAKLARALRRVLLERGVRLCEGTPMLTLRGGRAPVVETPAGSVRCDQVVLTHGAWAAADARFGRAFAVAVDYMVVTEPIPDLLAEIGWASHSGIADSRDMLYYLRRTEDDRIAIGGGGMGAAFDGRIAGRAAAGHGGRTSGRAAAGSGSRLAGRAFTSRHLTEVAARGLMWLFPQLAGVRFAAAWSGPMDVTRAGIPFFVSSSDGRLHAGLGFSGHGLTPTKVGGKTLASLVLGSDDEWSSLPVVGPPLTQVPPEPFRWPLVQSIAWLMETGDHAEELGGRRGFVRQTAGAIFDAYCNKLPGRRPASAVPAPSREPRSDVR
jgi:glycine/D-amino acid oxidase-like deaminating enzyme